MAEPDLLPLFAWLSPSYPVGAYAYSHGLEWAVESSDVTDLETLIAWLNDILRHGGGRNDAILFKEAWRAAMEEPDRISEISEFAVALTPSRERRLETTQQGRAFIDATLAAWPSDRFATLAKRAGDVIAYPVAVALATAAHGMPLKPALEAYLLAFTSNMASAAVRVIPLGQSDGQRAIARLSIIAREIADFAAQATLDELGGAALRSDLASLHHETQYSRLFRS